LVRNSATSTSKRILPHLKCEFGFENDNIRFYFIFIIIINFYLLYYFVLFSVLRIQPKNSNCWIIIDNMKFHSGLNIYMVHADLQICMRLYHAYLPIEIFCLLFPLNHSLKVFKIITKIPCGFYGLTTQVRDQEC